MTTPTDWRCRCGANNAGMCLFCEACGGPRPAGARRFTCSRCAITVVNGASCPQCGERPKPATGAPLLNPLESWKPDGPPPLTKAQASQVMAVIYAVIDRRLTQEQANARLAAIFTEHARTSHAPAGAGV